MQTQYITDDSGNKVAVILPIDDYRKMVDDLEEIQDVKLFDQAKRKNEPSLPADEAFDMIDKERKKKK